MTDRITPLPKIRENFERQFFGEAYDNRFDPNNSDRYGKALIIRAVFAYLEDALPKPEAFSAELVEMLESAIEISNSGTFIKDAKALIQKAKGGGNG
jgi:hypothetical protein